MKTIVDHYSGGRSVPKRSNIRFVGRVSDI
jgi:hypothetical protein